MPVTRITILYGRRVVFADDLAGEKMIDLTKDSKGVWSDGERSEVAGRKPVAPAKGPEDT